METTLKKPNKTCLLLNASFEPLKVVTSRRAIVLVLSEKAEIIENGEGLFHSEKTAIPVPAVVRLLKFVKVPYKAKVRITNRGVLNRDGHICQFSHCNNKADTVDHVFPRSRGGLHEWNNTVAACRSDNGKKGDRLMSELGWTLKRKPETPTRTAWLLVGITRMDPTWESYLRAEIDKLEGN